jgi:hypothetical protein
MAPTLYLFFLLQKSLSPIYTILKSQHGSHRFSRQTGRFSRKPVGLSTQTEGFEGTGQGIREIDRVEPTGSWANRSVW